MHHTKTIDDQLVCTQCDVKLDPWDVKVVKGVPEIQVKSRIWAKVGLRLHEVCSTKCQRAAERVPN